MTQNRANPIKSWIKDMGLTLTRSHLVDRKTRKVKYYTLGNFGIYEECRPSIMPERKSFRFISWKANGDPLEIKSVRDLSSAYQEFINEAQ